MAWAQTFGFSRASILLSASMMIEPGSCGISQFRIARTLAPTRGIRHPPLTRNSPDALPRVWAVGHGAAGLWRSQSGPRIL
jgi:hypothetical protein